MPSTPPTSPQRHQEAARQAERLNRVMASPEQCRTPAGSSTSAPPPPAGPSTSAIPPPPAGPSTSAVPPPPAGPSTSAVPPPPIAQASSEQNILHSLPQHLLAGLQNLIPIPPPPKCGRPSAPLLGAPSVSLVFILII